MWLEPPTLRACLLNPRCLLPFDPASFPWVIGPADRTYLPTSALQNTACSPIFRPIIQVTHSGSPTLDEAVSSLSYCDHCFSSAIPSVLGLEGQAGRHSVTRLGSALPVGWSRCLSRLSLPFRSITGCSFLFMASPKYPFGLSFSFWFFCFWGI